MGKRKVCFHHALLTAGLVVLYVYIGVLRFHSGPQIPLVLGCLSAGLMAMYLGYGWEDVLQGMKDGINGSLEAILILLMIGVLEGAWISAGTVPTIIYFGLKIVSPRIFLPLVMIACMLVALVIGSWGTVGTIGLAFMGIGISMSFPAPMVAGAIISGAYLGEAISPLSEIPNLAAAAAGTDVFSAIRALLPRITAAGVLCALLYALTGFGAGSGGGAPEKTAEMLGSLREMFAITPISLLPLLLIIVFILRRMPAIPAILFAALAGMAQAVALQGKSVGQVMEYAWSGYSGAEGAGSIGALLSAGGMQSMMDTVSVILLAMAFGGILRRTGQLDALTGPVTGRIRSEGGIKAVTVLSCVAVNAALFDQYLGITLPGQMYGQECEKRGIANPELGALLLGGGAVTSPLIPWNTCGIYCMSVLSVSPAAYLRYAYLGLLLPAVCILSGFLSAGSGVRRERRRQP